LWHRNKNIVADTESRILTKSSSARYYLTVKCRPTDKISDVMNILSSGSNIQMQDLEWNFREDRQRKLEWIREACAAAKETAQCMAEVSGVNISSVYHCAVNDYSGADGPPRWRGDNRMKMSIMNTPDAPGETAPGQDGLPSGRSVVSL
jgi:uncharacterized protein YggE